MHRDDVKIVRVHRLFIAAATCTLAVAACSLFAEDAGYVGDQVAPEAGSPDTATTADASSNVADGDAATPGCLPGFVAGDAGCVFANPFRDPSFQSDPPNAWTLDGATMYPAEAGVTDLGIVTIDTSFSSASGTVAQSTDVAPFVTTGPLALDVVAITKNAFSPPTGGMLELYAAKRVTARALENPYPDGMHALHVCVGERVHGIGVPFTFGLASNTFADRFDLDFVALVRDSTCPMPGVIPNGDFEGVGQWKLEGATIEVGQGTGGSKAASVKREDYNDTGISMLVSVPGEATPNSAISFTVRSSAPSAARMQIEGYMVSAFATDVAATTQYVCMAPWMRGSVVRLEFRGGNGITSGPLPAVYVDDVAFVSRPACTNEELQNGGFEAATALRGWLAAAGPNGTAKRITSGGVTGPSYLELKTPACVGDVNEHAWARQVVTVPDYDAASGGPALKYSYKLAAGTGATVKSADNVSLKQAVGWTQEKKCLNPNSGPKLRPGSRYEIVFYLFADAPGCGASTFALDDVTLGTDSSCP